MRPKFTFVERGSNKVLHILNDLFNFVAVYGRGCVCVGTNGLDPPSMMQFDGALYGAQAIDNQ